MTNGLAERTAESPKMDFLGWEGEVENQQKLFYTSTKT